MPTDKPSPDPPASTKKASTDKSVLLKTPVVLAAIALVVTALVAGIAIGKGMDVEWTTTTNPDGTTTTTLNAQNADLVELIDKLYSGDDASKQAIDELIMQRRSMYRVRDVRLAPAIREQACDSIPTGTPLTEELRLLEACAETDWNDPLRQLAKKREPPFHDVGHEVRVSVPQSGSQPPPGEVSACEYIRGETVLGRRLELLNPRRDTSIFVRATRPIGCSSIRNIRTSLHLNPGDARALFGHTISGVDTLRVLFAP